MNKILLVALAAALGLAAGAANGQECPFSGQKGVNGQECPFSGQKGANGQECPFSETVRLTCKTDAGDVRLGCDNPGGWRFVFTSERAADGAEILTATLKRETPARPPEFSVWMSLPIRDFHALWRPSTGTRRYDENTFLPPWGQTFNSSLMTYAPVYAFLNESGQAPLTIAWSEAKRRVVLDTAVKDRGYVEWLEIMFFRDEDDPMTDYTVRFRIDATGRAADDAIRLASDWVAEAGGYAPWPAPDSAYKSFFSTWYAYHNVFTDKDIERQSKLAADLGIEMFDIDHGWYRGSRKGFTYCGDWVSSPETMPDFAGTIRKMQANGVKCMVWFGLPFLGMNSEAWARFKDKTLRPTVWDEVKIFDPRYPDVREHLVACAERIVRDYGADGLKIDFIDWMSLWDVKTHKMHPDPAAKTDYAGCDTRSVPEGVARLLKGIRERVTALKPDAFVEFRQTYMGPAALQYCTQMRVVDCPGDRLSNRIGCANLRLTSGRTAVQGDTLMWSPAESPEGIAQYVIGCLFGTIQVSEPLETLTSGQKEMFRHWLAFEKKHMKALRRGTIKVAHPETNCSVITGESDDERVTGVYVPDAVVDLPGRKRTYVLNGTSATNLVLRLDAPAKVQTFDTYGHPAGTTGVSPVGLVTLALPSSGSAELTF